MLTCLRPNPGDTLGSLYSMIITSGAGPRKSDRGGLSFGRDCGKKTQRTGSIQLETCKTHVCRLGSIRAKNNYGCEPRQPDLGGGISGLVRSVALLAREGRKG